MASRLRFRQSNRKREIETRCHLSRLLVSETRHVKLKRDFIKGITHRFWETSLDSLKKSSRYNGYSICHEDVTRLKNNPPY